ncbi:(2Fe-2S)-binding protein [Rhodoplanes elegans]|uniref:(2Fe-2S)-binding protein n=1 Tax=Rhodoplanes elegans TaxID=29408 RepID=A0A327KLZ5_9BRAD|nr:(2Fe-2S)-binding protein [Rhodoplanes elegans]MBK5959618.1 (2Fe-2S)-binding protein [Rhodoplanes elegans]RAI39301.1 (2Fe-2S)-binding protein [Rhodoplanes elegans]
MTADTFDIGFTLNGQAKTIAVRTDAMLADVLRNDLGLLGTKISCNEGECGACTVLIDGRAANSCIVLAVEVDGCDVVTIEGIADGGTLHPIQEAFIAEGAVHCGYCTPGMILSTKALLDHVPEPDTAEIRKALEGNLCRCTGYNRILKAVGRAAATLRDVSSRAATSQAGE